MKTKTRSKLQSQIQVRIDTKTKEEAKKVFGEIGLDTSSAVKIFLKEVARSGHFPIDLRTINGFTLEQEREMIRETKKAIKYSKSYITAEEMHKDIFAD